MVSILMPIFNGLEFLNESVPSILNQTVQEWELLIGINGYPANSLVYQTVQAYIQYEPRIKVFDFPGCKGKAATLNKMIPHCQYAYVAILDVDDIWLPTKLETQWPWLEKKYDVIGTRCMYFGDLNSNGPNIPTGDLSSFNFLEGNPIINSSSLIKKELAHWDETSFIEDYALWLRLWKQGCRFYNCPDLLVKHRIHQASAFNSKGNHTHVDALLRGLGGNPPR